MVSDNFLKKMKTLRWIFTVLVIAIFLSFLTGFYPRILSYKLGWLFYPIMSSLCSLSILVETVIGWKEGEMWAALSGGDTGSFEVKKENNSTLFYIVSLWNIFLFIILLLMSFFFVYARFNIHYF